MSGEWQEYREAVEERKRSDYSKWFGRPPLHVRILRAIPFIFSGLIILGGAVCLFVFYGLAAGFLYLGALFFSLVLLPLLCKFLNRRR